MRMTIQQINGCLGRTTGQFVGIPDKLAQVIKNTPGGD